MGYYKMTQVSNLNSSLLCFVVGRSGSGKDLLMRTTAEYLTQYGLPVVILQRVITRKPDASEASKYVTQTQFQQMLQQDEFILSWYIYNTHFGVLRAPLLEFLSQGNIVLVNASRGILYEARQILPSSKIVYIEASPAICEQRILNRKRESQGGVNERIHRLHKRIEMPSPNFIVNNDGNLHIAVEAFSTILQELYDGKSG
jgi:ribose 1,5-bisphosphokinase